MDTQSVRKRVIIKELVKGQEAATKLKVLLENPFGVDGSLSSEELVVNVLRSFTEALSMITCSSQPCGDQNLLNSGENGSPVVVSGEGRKRSSMDEKVGRGCYKRRKSAQAWTRVSCTTDDDHAWRKYGQKEILNSVFPRSYFRCSYKNDQGCLATKQVQRTQENPDMYKTTYIGIHTCKATLKPTHLVIDSSTHGEPFPLNPDSDSKLPNEQDHHISSPSLTIKQEYPKQDTPSDVTDQKPAIVPLKMESDNADTVYSCTGSQGLDMEFGVESVHFGTDFHFDESQLLQCFD